MKGLILKDLMCLRKQLIIFSYVVVSVLVLSVMYVLSAKYGNIALANEGMMTENGMTSIDIKNLSTWVLAIFLLLPIATVGDAATIFVEDGKAGFSNVSASLPLSVEKRVMAKYMTVFAMFGIGVITDLVIVSVLSVLTDIVSFVEFFGIIISAASLMSIYGALVIVFCFLFGHGKEDYAIFSSCVVMVLSAILLNIHKIKKLFASASDAEGTQAFDAFIHFFKQKFYVLFFLAVITMVVSYFASVWIAKRKRGVV